MGGDIRVASKRGEGSIFTINLPSRLSPMRVSSLPPPRGRSTPPEQRSRSVHKTPPVVLAIDDEIDVLDWIRRTLKGLDVVIRGATSGMEGLALAQQIKPDVIILDVVMPGMDGWAVLNELKSDPDLSDIPVVMATVVEDQSMGFALGVTDYMTKPVERQKLLRVVKRYCHDDMSRPILIVEDDEPTRDSLRRTLEREGWAVREATNGLEGLARAAEVTPGLIILDLMMPEMDGFQFVDALRENVSWRSIPIIVITAKDLSRDEREGLHRSVQSIHQKGSYSRADLVKELRSLIETSKIGELSRSSRPVRKRITGSPTHQRCSVARRAGPRALQPRHRRSSDVPWVFLPELGRRPGPTPWGCQGASSKP